MFNQRSEGCDFKSHPGPKLCGVMSQNYFVRCERYKIFTFIPLPLLCTLHKIAQWQYICTSDLSSAFYQIPLAQSSMKYCGVVAPFKGTRVYAQCAMGMPSSETALEVLMCRVLGNLQERVVTKFSDYLLLWGQQPGRTYHKLEKGPFSLKRCGLCLSPTKTVIAPKKATILGRIWEAGTLTTSPHHISSLASSP